MTRLKRRIVGEGDGEIGALAEVEDRVRRLLALATPIARVSPDDALVEIGGQISLRIDAEGRWSAMRLGGTLYRRTVDCAVVRYPGAGSRPIDVPDAAPVHAHAVTLAAALHRYFATSPSMQLGLHRGARFDDLVGHLARAAAWTRNGYVIDEPARYRAAYPEPVEILPPDRYLDAVVLPARGCPNAGCTFCAFYRHRRFRPLSSTEFRQHLDHLVAFFGSAISLRRGLFLGSASALSLSQRRLLTTLAQTTQRLGPQPRGIGAFWDPDHAPTRSAADWLALHDAGLRAVYLGLETGSPRLRSDVGKSGDLAAVVTAIRKQRTAPIRTGLIVLCGIGGSSACGEHRTETARLIGTLDLGQHDRVFISPLNRSMPEQALAAEVAELRHALRRETEAKVAPYAMQAFRYFA